MKHFFDFESKEVPDMPKRDGTIYYIQYAIRKADGAFTLYYGDVDDNICFEVLHAFASKLEAELYAHYLGAIEKIFTLRKEEK